MWLWNKKPNMYLCACARVCVFWVCFAMHAREGPGGGHEANLHQRKGDFFLKNQLLRLKTWKMGQRAQWNNMVHNHPASNVT